MRWFDSVSAFSAVGLHSLEGGPVARTPDTRHQCERSSCRTAFVDRPFHKPGSSWVCVVSIASHTELSKYQKNEPTHNENDSSCCREALPYSMYRDWKEAEMLDLFRLLDTDGEGEQPRCKVSYN